MEFSFLYSSSLLAFIIDIAATILTRYSGILRIIKEFNTKKMDDVSFWLIYLIVGLFLYVIYGIIIDDFILIWGKQ